MRSLCLFLSLLSSAAFACQCDSLKKMSKEESAQYELIFRGTVDSVSACKTSAIAYFRVEELYKGYSPVRNTILFDCSSPCLMEFSKGQEWIIYSTVSARGVPEVKLCSHSRKRFAKAEEDYYTVNSGMTYDEEAALLKSELSLHTLLDRGETIKDTSVYDHRNTQPSPYTKIVLLLVSAVVLVLLYYLFNKYFR